MFPVSHMEGVNLLTITSGPTGEELGWRGYMREEFYKKYGFLKSAVCQGLVWTFWHALLWIVDSDFTGWSTVLYIIANIVTTSITVLMNIFPERRNNIVFSILMHFGFNVIYMFSLDMEIEFCVILTVLYLIVTPIAVWI